MKTNASKIFQRAVLPAVALLLAVGFAAPLVFADAPNAWQITDNSTAAGSTLNYTIILPADLRSAATNHGFRYTVNARYVTNFAGANSLTMIYAVDTRRFLVFFNLNANDDLTAQLEGGPTFTLTTNGTGSAHYHLHEFVFNPSDQTASYVVDGVVQTSGWAPVATANPAGMVHFGAGISGGKGQMNFNSAIFTVTNTVFASYQAGTANNTPIAPNPASQGWTLNQGNPSLTSATNISPDFGLGFGQLPGITLPGGVFSHVAWGDYDNDGRLDFLFTGTTNQAASGARSQIWRNTGSGFTDVTASVAPGLPGVYGGSAAWGDYDNDGRLDFLLTGTTEGTVFGARSQIWRNTGNGFTNVTASVAPGLTGVFLSAVAWGDYNNDGRLDFFLTGDNGSFFSSASQLWQNTGSGFTNVTHEVMPGLREVLGGSVAWGDYDNDGRLDLLLTGREHNGLPPAQLWRNTGSGFTNATAIAPGLPGVHFSSVAWGDYDNDGRLDFLLAGRTNFSGGNSVSQLWRNTGNGFTNITSTAAPGLPGVYDSSVAWGDCDNDGRLDFLLTGLLNGTTPLSQIWRNTGSGFTNATASLAPGSTGVFADHVAWGDYDNDGRLDFLVTGRTNEDFSSAVIQFWRNNLPTGSNSPPAAPANLTSTVSGAAVALNWTAPTDDQTPPGGLHYSVRIGTSPGASDVMSAMSDTNGLRLLPILGNAQMRTNGLFQGRPGETYFWSVQALDTSFAGSPFAQEAQFTVPGLLLFNLTRNPGGDFEFSFTNLSLVNCEVLVSTNAALPLAEWTNLGPPMSLGGGLFRFTDTEAALHPQRFYLLSGE